MRRLHDLLPERFEHLKHIGPGGATTVDGRFFARFGWNLRQNCAEKRDTPAARNWPRREAPQPILRAACVAFFRAIWFTLGVVFSQIV